MATMTGRHTVENRFSNDATPYASLPSQRGWSGMASGTMMHSAAQASRFSMNRAGPCYG
jgi:hypothetical protein